jgi:hypothetical protein
MEQASRPLQGEVPGAAEQGSQDAKRYERPDFPSAIDAVFFCGQRGPYSVGKACRTKPAKEAERQSDRYRDQE